MFLLKRGCCAWLLVLFLLPSTQTNMRRMAWTPLFSTSPLEQSGQEQLMTESFTPAMDTTSMAKPAMSGRFILQSAAGKATTSASARQLLFRKLQLGSLWLELRLNEASTH